MMQPIGLGRRTLQRGRLHAGLRYLVKKWTMLVAHRVRAMRSFAIILAGRISTLARNSPKQARGRPLRRQDLM
jgi:hypothetical protein